MGQDLLGREFRMKDPITLDVKSTVYTVKAVELDEDIPGLVWMYMVSEYADDNIEFEHKFNLKYAKITNNQEGLLI